MNYTKENQVVQKTAKDVLRVVDRNIGNTQTARTKTHARDPVSDLDIVVDKLIARKLQSSFRDDVIVTEESSPELVERVLTEIGRGL